MKLDEQRQWYESWHQKGPSTYPVENMKQAMRLESLAEGIKSIRVQSVLFVGCGQGDELRLVEAKMIVAIDLSHAAVLQAQTVKPQESYLQADGMKLPFSNASFDTVITSEVIEHILEPSVMLAEIHRVLVKGGKLIVTTPNQQSFFGLARKLGEFVLRRPVTSDEQPVDNWSSPSSLKSLLHKAGLAVDLERGAWYFPPTGLGKKRLPDKIMASLFTVFLPLERWLQAALPGWGHLLLMVAHKTEVEN
jgi:2-polyprenyl-3-methyl-5-hydroxy-6-metoxy-1,4-benzoquinol methylase